MIPLTRTQQDIVVTMAIDMIHGVERAVNVLEESLVAANMPEDYRVKCMIYGKDRVDTAMRNVVHDSLEEKLPIHHWLYLARQLEAESEKITDISMNAARESTKKKVDLSPADAFDCLQHDSQDLCRLWLHFFNLGKDGMIKTESTLKALACKDKNIELADSTLFDLFTPNIRR